MSGLPTPHRCSTLRIARRRALPEAGFTLIELIIGMVLLAIAFGLVATGVMHAFSASGTSTAGTISESMVKRASAALTDDVSKAETQAHADTLLRDPGEFANAVRNGAKAYSSDPASPGVIDVDDVVEASATKLTVWANVNSDPDAECVTWEGTVSGTKYTLVRTVREACGGAATQTDTFVRAKVGVAGVVTTPFAYVLQCSRSVCPGSSAPAANPCQPWTATSATGAKLRWITQVRATFASTGQSGKGFAVGVGSATMTIRSRDTVQYRSALGC